MGLSMGNAISTCFFAFLEVEFDRPSLNTSENFFTWRLCFQKAYVTSGSTLQHNNLKDPN